MYPSLCAKELLCMIPHICPTLPTHPPIINQKEVFVSRLACSIHFFGDFPACVHISLVKVDSARHLGMSIVIYFCTRLCLALGLGLTLISSLLFMPVYCVQVGVSNSLNACIILYFALHMVCPSNVMNLI